MRERAEQPTEARRGGPIGRGGRDRGRGLGPIPALLQTGTKRTVFAAALLVVALTLVSETDARALEEAGETVLYAGAPAVSVPTAREAGVVARSYEDEVSPAVLAALIYDTGGLDPLVEEALASVTAVPEEPDAVTSDEAENAGRVFLAQTDEESGDPDAPAGTGEYASGGPVRPELGAGKDTPELVGEGADEEPRDPGPGEVVPSPAGGPELAWASTGVDGSVPAPPEDEPEPIELISSPGTGAESSGDPALISPAYGGEVSAPDDATARTGPLPEAEQVPVSLTSEELTVDDGTGESGGEPASTPTVEPAGDEVVEGIASAPPESPEETAHPGTSPAYKSELPEAPPLADGEERVSLVVTPPEGDSGSSEEDAPFSEEAEISASPPEDTTQAQEDADEPTAHEGDPPEETSIRQGPGNDPSAGEPHAEGARPPERPDERHPEETGEDPHDEDPGGVAWAAGAQPGRAEAPAGAEGGSDDGPSGGEAPRPETPTEARLRNEEGETGALAPQTEPEDPVRRPDRPSERIERPTDGGEERPRDAKPSEERRGTDPRPAEKHNPESHDGAPKGGSPERIVERIKRSDGGTAAMARRAERDAEIAAAQSERQTARHRHERREIGAGTEGQLSRKADGTSAMATAGRGGAVVVDEARHGRAGRETPHRTKESKTTEEGD